MDKNKVTRTNLGEEYNRQSMYETARDTLLDCKVIKMNGKYYDSLIGVIVEDFEQELEKEEKCLQDSENALKTKDFGKVLDSFSKTMSRRKVTDQQQERIETALKEIKNNQASYIRLREYFKIIDRDLGKFSVEQIKKSLQVLKNYEKILLQAMSRDCIELLTCKEYKNVKKYIKKVEEELTNRQANLSL